MQSPSAGMGHFPRHRHLKTDPNEMLFAGRWACCEGRGGRADSTVGWGSSRNCVPQIVQSRAEWGEEGGSDSGTGVLEEV